MEKGFFFNILLFFFAHSIDGISGKEGRINGRFFYASSVLIFSNKLDER
jgi:hypothetical protein